MRKTWQKIIFFFSTKKQNDANKSFHTLSQLNHSKFDTLEEIQKALSFLVQDFEEKFAELRGYVEAIEDDLDDHLNT